MNEQASAEKWASHNFFAPNTVVLGLDIGIKWIGITIRKGKEWLYSKSLRVNLPEAHPLAKRRQFRAARHARKNRRVRMRRLAKLFQKHGLPWVTDDVSSRCDPFMLRYRALKGILASREALSLCIRSCVMHRGFDYGAMSREEGEYPWGTENSYSEAKKWLSSAYVDSKLRNYLLTLSPDLTKRGKELDDEDIQEWEKHVNERAEKADQEGIPRMLENYAKNHNKKEQQKARGRNYPRAHVEDHLRQILEKHKHLIDDYDGFVEALFLPNNTLAQKKKSIFHYNRKTPEEAKKHYESKVKNCPYGKLVDSSQEYQCGKKGDPAIRLWTLVDFLSNHRFYLTQGKLPSGLQLLPEEGIRVLVNAIQHEKETNERGLWRVIKTKLEEELRPLSIEKNNEWNKRQLDQLKDIVVPSGAMRARRAGISVAAAEDFFAKATQNGSCLNPGAIEQWKKDKELYLFRQKISNTEGGIYPQVRTLIGTLRKARKGGGFATTGLLQRIFEKELKDKLGEKVVPDYCVVECIKNPALNEQQKKEIEEVQKTNQENKKKLAKEYSREKLTHADMLRLRLFVEQGGNKRKNQPAICPFTGQELGTDPFASHLELAHIFPDSKGGPYMAENLVLTTREINAQMYNDTPQEAAAKALPGWLSWDNMKAQMKDFRWSKQKKELFCFGESGNDTFPDFNNMTRTAQLARELRRMVAVWMGIEKDVEAIRTRIGNIAGIYTAAARRCMLGNEFIKDRGDNNHHRKDAAVMTCIPPAEGVNDVKYGGVFATVLDEKKNRRLECRLPEEILPDFSKLDTSDECPIIMLKSRSKYKSLGDSTFWRVEKDGTVSQRISLSSLDVGEITSSDISKTLKKAVEYATEGKSVAARKILMDKIPSEKEIKKWIDGRKKATKNDKISEKPLKNQQGTPIKSIRNRGAKATMVNSPLKWSGIIPGDNARFRQMRILDESNERLELWLGWDSDTKRQKWKYITRVVPTKTALDALKRMGLPWRGRRNAPTYLIKLLEKEGAKDLKSLVCGTLPKGSIKVGEFRKGDIYEMDFKKKEPKEGKNKKSKEASRPKSENKLSANDKSVKEWGYITAVKSDKNLKFECCALEDRKPATLQDPAKLAALLNLESAEKEAVIRNMTPPV